MGLKPRSSPITAALPPELREKIASGWESPEDFLMDFVVGIVEMSKKLREAKCPCLGDPSCPICVRTQGEAEEKKL